MSKFEPTTEKLSSYRQTSPPNIFTILTVLFVISIIFVFCSALYLYRKLYLMYVQFIDFSSSLYLILSILEIQIPEFDVLKEKIDDHIQSLKTKSTFPSFPFVKGKSKSNQLKDIEKETGMRPNTHVDPSSSSIIQECTDENEIERAFQIQKQSVIVNENANINDSLDGASYVKTVITTPSLLPSSSSAQFVTKAVVETIPHAE